MDAQLREDKATIQSLARKGIRMVQKSKVGKSI